MLMFHRGVGKNGFSELQVQKDLNRSGRHRPARGCSVVQGVTVGLVWRGRWVGTPTLLRYLLRM